MTKAELWNEIKTTFKFVNSVELQNSTGKTYAQITKEELRCYYNRLIDLDLEVDEDLSNGCIGDTVATVNQGNEDNSIIIHTQANEVYISTTYCFNPKRLIDCTDKELIASVYKCKAVAEIEANEWIIDNYQVIEVSLHSIREDIKQYFRNRVGVEG